MLQQNKCGILFVDICYCLLMIDTWDLRLNLERSKKFAARIQTLLDLNSWADNLFKNQKQVLTQRKLCFGKIYNSTRAKPVATEKSGPTPFKTPDKKAGCSVLPKGLAYSTSIVNFFTPYPANPLSNDPPPEKITLLAERPYLF